MALINFSRRSGSRRVWVLVLEVALLVMVPGSHRLWINKATSCLFFVVHGCPSAKEYLKQINDELPKLAEMIHGDTVNDGGVSYDDITLWPTLRRLTIVKGIKWPEKLRNYLLYMEDVCDVPILEGMAI